MADHHSATLEYLLRTANSGQAVTDVRTRDLAVPVTDFAGELKLAATGWSDDPTNAFIRGVLGACLWLVIPDDLTCEPLCGYGIVPSVQGQSEIRELAYRAGLGGHPRIDPGYAQGVYSLLAWASGADTTPPLWVAGQAPQPRAA